MKYFEKNAMANEDLDDLQLRLLEASTAVVSNLTYHMTQDDAGERRHQATMMKSVYTAIFILEAIASQFDEDVRREGYEDVDEFNEKLLAKRKLMEGFHGAFELEVPDGIDAAEFLKKILGL